MRPIGLSWVVPLVLNGRSMVAVSRRRWLSPSAFGRGTADVHVRPEDLKQGPMVLVIFLITQLLDGVLTYWGVTRFGVDLEMNTLLVATIHQVGPAAALLGAKGLACLCGVILYLNLYLRPLAAVAGLCLGVAVVPWLFLAAWVL